MIQSKANVKGSGLASPKTKSEKPNWTKLRINSNEPSCAKSKQDDKKSKRVKP